MVILAAMCMFLPGCDKVKEQKPDGIPPAEAPVRPDDRPKDADKEGTAQPGTIQLETPEVSAGEGGEEKKEKKDVPEVKREAGMEAFLAIREDAWIVPEDFVIGPLQPRYTTDEEKAEIITLAMDFFENLSAGVLDEDLILKEWRETIKTSLLYYIEKDLVPQEVRMGTISFSDNLSAHCNIRLYRDDGVSAGEVYFTKEVKSWYISDIQIDFSLLAEPYIPAGEPYEPGVYTYLETY